MNPQDKIEQTECLAPYRALDLTDEKGFLCGSLLGGLGMDVIKIERPGGDPSRNIDPFYHDVPGPEKSLYFFAYNTNKRGITLNIETRDGREIFKRLVKGADFVIESFTPGYLDGLGLGYRDLEKVNPRIILTSITPFGQTGPHANYKASDILGEAMGGKMYITGDEDRPPVRMSIRQACLHGSMHATVGTLIAHYYREISDEGQHVDVSLQESVIPTISGEMDWWFMQHNVKHREGATVHRGHVTEHEIWPAKDGYVNFRFMAGKFTAGIRPLAEWMDEEGMAGALKEIKDWEALDMTKITQEQMDAWEEAFGNFFKQHTLNELHEGAIKRQFYFGPCYDANQVPTDSQLKARGYWTQIEHPELDDFITYPGAPFKLSLTPWRIYRRAPLIGEHNMEILEQELGLSRDELVSLREANVI